MLIFTNFRKSPSLAAALVALFCALFATGPGLKNLQAQTSSDETLIAAEPLVESTRQFNSTTLFELMPPEETGVDLVIPIDVNHPLCRAYHSSSACGAVAIGDMDLDGKPDMFIGNGPGKNALYLQTGDLKFTDVAEETGLAGGNLDWAVGVSLADIDGDGDLDIFLCNYDAPNQLFINQLIVDGKRKPEGTPLSFVESAAELGLDVADGCVVAAIADYDRDGDLDVYLLTHQIYRENGRPSEPIGIVSENGKLEVAKEWRRWYTMVQGKRGDNGELLYTEAGRPDYMMRNDGDKGFTNVTAAAGITTDRHWGNSATWWDYNHDSWPDLYVGNDFSSPDFLYRNNGDGTFTEVAESVVRHSTWFSMGAVQSDFNNDGLIDFLLADMMPKTHYMQKASMASMGERHDNLEDVGGPQQLMRNTMHINTGTDRFLEGAWMADLAETEWTWAIRSADFDCDGLADVFFCNGVPRQFNHSDLPSLNHAQLVGKTHWDHYVNTPERREQNLAYKNFGDFHFEDKSAAWGLDHLGMSYGASLGDLDGDGRLELVTSNLEDPISVYRNTGKSGHRITIELCGTQSNPGGIGTLVRIVTPDGVSQVRQLFPYGGFLDADEPLMHFGLGENATISSMSVEWPSGQKQTFKNLKTDQHYTITEPQEVMEKDPPVRTRRPSAPMFEESLALQKFPHKETTFDDFAEQPLLPFKLSQLGPGQAWGDIDGDGDLDMFLAGAAGQAGQLFNNATQQGSGDIVLQPRLSAVLAIDAPFEDMGAAFIDADGDGDLDLYVSSGSTEFPVGSPMLRDRLYINNGAGDFEAAPQGALPLLLHNSGVVAPADFDRDGDLDLFVGSRSIAGDFPSSPESVLLVNEGGRFIKVTADLAPDLKRSGMVTGALWSDVDNDGWVDLLVTHDWGPIKLFRNNKGLLVDATLTAKLDGEGIAGRGWWTGIDGRDLDGDGDIDYVATNLGRNTPYRAELASPELIFYGDFDNSGKKHIVEAHFLEEQGNKICYPWRGFMASMKAMPYIGDKMQTYHEYASVPLNGIYDLDKLNQSTVYRANRMDNVALINDGEGHFEMVPLPRISQTSPSFGVVLRDIDLDGHPDCYLVQNLHAPHEEIDEIQTGLSFLLRGTGDSKAPFEAIWPRESGLEVPGDAKSLAAVDLNADGREDFVVGVNNNSSEVFINRTGDRNDNISLALRINAGPGNAKGIGTRVSIEASPLPAQTAEVGGGGSYLTQSSTDLIFALPKDTRKVALKIRWPDGTEETREIEVKAGVITLSRNKTSQ